MFPTWLGTQVLKNPFDLWIYQELLARTRPDVIIETGTFAGGSALYLAFLGVRLCVPWVMSFCASDVVSPFLA
jgi:cephalosporin hydroxylase